MKSKNSIYLNLLSILPLSIIPICVVSCKDFYTNGNIGGLSNDWNNKIKQECKTIEQNYKNDPTNEENKKKYELLSQKTIQITTGGKVNDFSFNQMVWETISAFSKAINNDSNRYYETLSISQDMSNDAYNYAIANGYKIWILTGFQQETLLKNWLSIGRNKERFDNEKIKVITVDWYNENLTLPGRLLGLNFKTQESSFVVAYSAAKLLSEIYPGNNNIKNRYFNSFGGGDFSGVTNFNYGFYEGLRQWNSEQNSNDTKVASTYVNSNESVDLTTSFSITNDSRAKVNNAVDGYNNGVEPKVILPVAGSLTSVAIDRVLAKKSQQWIIGVDTDASLSFPSNKNLILTSSEKKIAIAVYKALSLFYGLNEALDNDALDIKVNEDFEIVDENNKLINMNKTGGYKEGFVDVSKSTLDPSLKFSNGTTYATRFDEIVEQTYERFFASGLLENNKPNNINDPVTFNNVFYGFMTAGNLSTYFNPAIFGDKSRNIIGVNSWLNGRLFNENKFLNNSFVQNNIPLLKRKDEL